MKILSPTGGISSRVAYPLIAVAIPAEPEAHQQTTYSAKPGLKFALRSNVSVDITWQEQWIRTLGRQIRIARCCRHNAQLAQRWYAFEIIYTARVAKMHRGSSR